jgi:hypothetical protein
MKVLRWVKKAILLSENASLDVDLRYMPVARFLREMASAATILEVGSGYIGITPYIDRTVVGVDAEFPAEPMPNMLPVISKAVLPFRDRTFDVVISLDTLEHVPREFRQLFWNELIRTAKRYVIVGFPEGEEAEEHDRLMEQFYIRQHGSVHQYFVEHRTHRIPRGEEVAAYLLGASNDTRREFTVRQTKNVNIRIRALFMRLIWHHKRSFQRLYFALTAFSRWDKLFHFGSCYRSIYFLSMKQP